MTMSPRASLRIQFSKAPSRAYALLASIPLAVLMFGLITGWAYWIWLAIQLDSFAMFLFGLLGPLGIVAAVLGMWSLLFGAPVWLSYLAG